MINSTPLHSTPLRSTTPPCSTPPQLPPFTHFPPFTLIRPHGIQYPISCAMLGSQHVFSHQAYPPTDWPQNHQQQQHNNNSHHAGQQHYNRVAASNNSSTAGIAAMNAADHNQSMPAPEQGMSDDTRKVLDWVAQLMSANTRETALLELSKKREQVPELALILWHSFGAYQVDAVPKSLPNSHTRRYDLVAARDHLSLSATQSFPAHGCRVQQGLQCTGAPSVCSLAHRDTTAVPQRYVLHIIRRQPC